MVGMAPLWKWEQTSTTTTVSRHCIDDLDALISLLPVINSMVRSEDWDRMMGGELGRVPVVHEVGFYWEVVVEGGLQGKGRVLLTRMVKVGWWSWWLSWLSFPAEVSDQIKFDVEYLSYECTVFIFVVIVYLRWPQINWTLSISCKKRKVYWSIKQPMERGGGRIFKIRIV